MANGLSVRHRLAVFTSLLALVVTLAAPMAEAKKPVQTNVPANLISSVVFNNGQLFAVTADGGQFPIALAATPNGTNCPILNLELGPINLNLLGLLVQTSPICLDITAQRGGGLLGNLLCSVSHLLDQGLTIGDIFNALDPQDQTRLLRAIRDILNGVLNQAVVTGGQPNATNPTPPANGCAILNLELGPITLNLLGLVVEVDNCNNGPVTVDITAIPGGGLLGNLLCGIANLDPLGWLNQFLGMTLAQFLDFLRGLL